MKKISLLIFAFSLIFTKAQEIKEKKSQDFANKILDNYLKQQLNDENPKPEEFKSAREFYLYDIDDDGDKDLIAFYTLEGFGGGNNWQHSIAIFLLSNFKVKAADDLVLFGDSFKKYHDGELIEFKNGYVYYKLYGVDLETEERIIKTIGITIKRNEIVTTKEL